MNINNMMKQAQELQKKMVQIQRELETTLVEGEAGAGLVKVSMFCTHQLKRVHIDPSLMDEESEMLEDLITAAFNNAIEKATKMSAEKTAGLNLPKDFNFPTGE